MDVVHMVVSGDDDDDDGGGGDDNDDDGDDNDDDGDDDGYRHANNCRFGVQRMQDTLRWKAFMLAVAAHKQRCKACHQFLRCHALRYL